MLFIVNINNAISLIRTIFFLSGQGCSDKRGCTVLLFGINSIYNWIEYTKVRTKSYLEVYIALLTALNLSVQRSKGSISILSVLFYP